MLQIISSYLLQQQTLDTAQQEYLKCIIDYKLDSSLGEILCIYYLKNNEWVELATLPDGFNSGKKLTGMHILGRGTFYFTCQKLFIEKSSFNFY